MDDQWTSSLPNGRTVKYTYQETGDKASISAKVDGGVIIMLEIVSPMTRVQVEQHFRSDLER